MADNRPMRIAWCSDPEEFHGFNVKVARKVEAAGHDVVVLHGLADLDRAGDRFDVGILRTRDAAEDPECHRVAALLEQAGVPFLNSVAARDATRDKSITHALFEGAGIPQPEWALAAAAPSLFPGPVALKPLRGGRSEGIEVFDSIGEALASTPAPERYLVQRYFPRAASWRVIGTPDRVVRGFRKITVGGVSREERWARLRLFYPPPRAVRELAMRMVAAVGGAMMGADVIVASGRALALELNTNFYLPLRDRRSVRGFLQELVRAGRA